MKVNRNARMVFAASVATLVLFIWVAFSHMVLIRGIGYSAIPNENRFVESESLSHISAGLYAFPAPPDWLGETPSDELTAAWEQRFRDGPSGMLIIRPRSEGPISIHKLVVQLTANAIAVSLALFVLSSVPGNFFRRATTVAAVGLVGLASVGVIYWNWYAFTNAFFAAQCLDILGGWILVGCVIAALAPQPLSNPGNGAQQ